MVLDDGFQGVVCCCLDADTSTQDTIFKLLGLTDASTHRNIKCFDLELRNKYYTAKINLFDYDEVPLEKARQGLLLEDSHAIILYGCGAKVTTDLLDSKLEALRLVGGEPRVFLCGGVDEDCEVYKSLLDWSIRKGYDLICSDDNEAKMQLINSLSAYRWTNRQNKNEGPVRKPELDGEVLKKLMDFDSLLGKLKAYRDQPELRGNPEDKNIVEIAEILTGLLGDDVDNFLDGEEVTTEASPNLHGSAGSTSKLS